MKVRKEWIGSKKPATQGNLADLQEDIHLDLMQMELRLSKKFATKEDLKGLMSKETGEELLGYMKSIDRRLKDQHDLPEEVDKLKTRVFKLELRH